MQVPTTGNPPSDYDVPGWQDYSNMSSVVRRSRIAKVKTTAEVQESLRPLVLRLKLKDNDARFLQVRAVPVNVYGTPIAWLPARSQRRRAGPRNAAPPRTFLTGMGTESATALHGQIRVQILGQREEQAPPARRSRGRGRTQEEPDLNLGPPFVFQFKGVYPGIRDSVPISCQGFLVDEKDLTRPVFMEGERSEWFLVAVNGRRFPSKRRAHEEGLLFLPELCEGESR